MSQLSIFPKPFSFRPSGSARAAEIPSAVREKAWPWRGCNGKGGKVGDRLDVGLLESGTSPKLAAGVDLKTNSLKPGVQIPWGSNYLLRRRAGEV